MADNQGSNGQSYEELKKKNEELKDLLRENQNRLQEAEETLEAIRSGGVDGLVRHTSEGNQIFILKGAEQPYRNLIEEMNEGALLVSKSGVILYCNSGFAKLVDVQLDRVMGTDVKDWVLPSSVETLSKIFSNNYTDEKKVFEITFQTGTKRPVATLVSVNSVQMGSLDVLGLIVTDLTRHMEDDIKRYTGKLETEISQRKTAEEALEAAQKKYQDLIETTGDFIWEVDTQGRYTYCSPQMERLWEIKPEEMIGKTPFDKMPDEDREKGAQLFASLIKNAKPFNGLQLPSLDGRERLVTVEISGVPFFDDQGRLAGYRGITRDITERKKVDKEIESLAKFPMENPAAVLRVDRMGIVLFANPTGTCFLKEWQTRVGESVPESIGQMISSALASGERIGFEANLGEETFSFVIAPIKAEGYANLYGRNSTKRKKAEAQLEQYAKNLETLVKERTQKLESTALYARSLIEASIDPLVTINMEGKITDVNKATEEATGLSREQLIGSDFSDYFTEPEKAAAVYKQVFTEGFVMDYPLAIRHKSGKVTEVLYNASVYRNADGQVQGVFAAARDISERRRAEERVRAAEEKLKEGERLAAIGATAGMVGHDIRNPLQAIVGDIYLLKDYLTSMPDMPTKSYVSESLEGIEANINYINKIVLDLQDYARPLRPVTKEIDIRPLIEAALESSAIPENIKTHYHIDKDANILCTDPDLLKRILNNLGANAIQAMPKGGEVFVRVKRNNEGTTISIEDTGIGIPEELKPKLFQPMITTKAKGQGFGLAVVKRMTEALGGSVSFESELGKGTKFTIKLPTQP